MDMAGIHRWVVPALAVALVGTVGGDIGVAATRHSNGHHSAATPRATPSPRPTVPPVPSRTLALRLGKATLITAHDMPGWSHSGKFGLNSDAGESGLSCGTSPEGIQGAFEADSPDFSRGPNEVSASIAAFPTSRGPRQDIEDARTPDAIKCLKAQLVTGVKQAFVHGERVTGISLTRIPVPKWGEASVGLRFHCVIVNGPAQITTYVDLIGFSIGRVEVGATFGSAQHPTASSTERRVMSLMADRAKRALR
jgi:hypothetical protein